MGSVLGSGSQSELETASASPLLWGLARGSALAATADTLWSGLAAIALATGLL